MILNRILPYLSILIIFFGFEIINVSPLWIYLIVLILLIWVLFTVSKLLGLKTIIKLKQIHFLILPLAFVLSAALLAIFVKTILLRHGLFAFTAIFTGLFLESLFVYVYGHEDYRAGSIEGISKIINLATCYFLFSGIYGLSTMVGLPLWQTAIMALAAAIIIGYEILWINKIPDKVKRLSLFVIILILIELFIAINLLPTGIYVDAFILTTLYYAIANIISDHYAGSLKRKVALWYLIISFLMLLLVLMTAQWT